jgi:hypothetical protein
MGSFYNDGEAAVVVLAVQRLLQLGLAPTSLGVIALCMWLRWAAHSRTPV